ncbi:MAG: hypothetical protein ACSLEL_05180 [Candidatus Malihini olakiniferum]
MSETQGDKTIPETLIGNNFHTTMINELDVLGGYWYIEEEAEAAILAYSVSMLLPGYSAFKFTANLGG